ncbi:MAG: indole-3-glycerol-phosphate synthase TrpC, partial [Corynebacterium variabile]|nr:indole-3-glycerol-phosphate synthase TrpC [Corynebacterium variabile]
MTVLDEIIAGVLEDTARREAEVPLAEIKAR